MSSSSAAAGSAPRALRSNTKLAEMRCDVFTSAWLRQRVQQLAGLYFPDEAGMLHKLPFWDQSQEGGADLTGMTSWEVIGQFRFLWKKKMTSQCAVITLVNKKNHDQDMVVGISSSVFRYLSVEDIDSTLLHFMVHVYLYLRAPVKKMEKGIYLNHAGLFLSEKSRINAMGGVQIENEHRAANDVLRRFSRFTYRCNFCEYEARYSTKVSSTVLKRYHLRGGVGPDDCFNVNPSRFTLSKEPLPTPPPPIPPPPPPRLPLFGVSIPKAL